MRNLLAVGLFLSCLTSFGQDATMILKQSFDKCQSIQNGYYEMTKYNKYMSAKDTVRRSITCYFKKLKDDGLYSSAFHYKTVFDDTVLFDVMYTGADFVTASSVDSTATIMSKSQWAKEIKSYAHNYIFYSPLTTTKSAPLPNDSDYLDNQHVVKFINQENVNGELCYHIQMNVIPKSDKAAPQILRQEYHYWIKKSDFIPVQYSIAFDIMIKNDTMHQYEKFILHKYDINSLKDESVLTLSSLPASYKFKSYVPAKSPDLLATGTIAPDWELPTLTDKKVSLKSLQGQLVLIDFFYKACYPCILAFPSLQALAKKYKNKGLQVIGIDPFDKKDDDLKTFLSKQGISYTVLLNGKDVANDYHVSGYPTLYLIDKTGKIMLVKQGYSKDMEKELDDFIKKNL
jgi:peroxiredoxin